MKYTVDPQQGRLFDPFQQIIPALGLKRIYQGWQSIFRALLLSLMPVKELGSHFHPTFGRPTKELYSVAGLLFLQEAFDWTNAEATEVYLFRTDVQFALNLEPGIDQICERTLERYRSFFLEDDLGAQIMNDTTLKLVDELDLNIQQQRLDSTHIFSDMASFGRTRMMAVANKRFLTQVLRHHPVDFAALPEDLRERYAPAQAKLFAGKGLSADQRVKNRQQVAEDMRDLINRFADHANLKQRPSYQALVTVFTQQCEIVDDKIEVKKATGGRCVQNPSDVDATYDGHKGQGYQVQIVETCSPENEVQLIVSALAQTAVESDANAFEPVLADLKAKDLLPEQILADTTYGSDENVQMAAALGVELVAPVPSNTPVVSEPVPDTAAAEVKAAAVSSAPEEEQTSAPPSPCEQALAETMEKLTIDDFAMDERTGKVEACPQGRIPLQVVSTVVGDKVKTTIEMKPSDCEGCPFREACPIEKTKKGKYKLSYTDDERRREERRREQATEPFKERYGRRSGIESTNGGLKRKMGMGELRVRGRPAVYHAIYLKIAGWNLSRAAASGKLVSRVAEILRKLGLGGFGGCLRVFCAVLWLIRAIAAPWRPQVC